VLAVTARVLAVTSQQEQATANGGILLHLLEDVYPGGLLLAIAVAALFIWRVFLRRTTRATVAEGVVAACFLVAFVLAGLTAPLAYATNHAYGIAHYIIVSIAGLALLFVEMLPEAVASALAFAPVLAFLAALPIAVIPALSSHMGSGGPFVEPRQEAPTEVIIKSMNDIAAALREMEQRVAIGSENVKRVAEGLQQAERRRQEGTSGHEQPVLPQENGRDHPPSPVSQKTGTGKFVDYAVGFISALVASGLFYALDRFGGGSLLRRGRKSRFS